MGQPVIIQVENICYPILAIVGVPANLVTIIILSREICDLSKCVTRYFVAMAVADLSVLLQCENNMQVVESPLTKV
ncbi:probable G-protein coupled receptor 139 isoform X2 [Stegostoma tigrinum]|uniref:probable G-protein coupled receptor 139 isoform X2 n=1 Tax=Stegostoma tigrinum TaxID=3053191 RepID=UPI00202B5B47|nr:probable G-protein coupled receptor 139 isoform X2 [Stegostoma tigrinum]